MILSQTEKHDLIYVKHNSDNEKNLGVIFYMYTFFKRKDLPNILTMCRIYAIPVVLFCLLWFPDVLVFRVVSTTFFLLVALTDFFDGYLARRMKAESDFGRCFDPIADKVLVVAVLFVLVSSKKADIVPALIIVCREVIASGLREFAKQRSFVIKVSLMSKWKAVLQFVGIGIILFSHSRSMLCDCGNIVLWLAAALAAVSVVQYVRECNLKMYK